MAQVIRFRHNCARREDVVAADRDAVRSVVNTPGRIRKVCEMLLKLGGFVGHVSVETGAELGDGVMEFFASVHLVGDADAFDEPAFWEEARRCLGADMPRAQPDDSVEGEGGRPRGDHGPWDEPVPDPGPVLDPPDAGPPSDGPLETEPVDGGLTPFDPFDEELEPPPINLVGVEREWREELCVQSRECLLIQVNDPNAPPILIPLRPRGDPDGVDANVSAELDGDRKIEVGMNISDLMANAVVMRSGLYILSEYEVLPEEDDE